jgi:fucose permease
MNNEKRVRFACYLTNISMAVVGNLPAILFLTFKDLYNISYSLMGCLVFINFLTQLIVDLMFSFFSYKINMQKAVKITPFLSIIGLFIYGIYPILHPQSAIVGIILGTIIFSAGSGFAEVLISPVIAALPSENPERDMSKLHSIYAWGAVGVVLLSTLFLFVFKGKNWCFLPLGFASISAISCVLFSRATLPQMQTPEKATGVIKLLKTPVLWLFFIAMFLGGASEVTMAQWSSSYLEQSLRIPKVWGDIFGVAMFSVMLGLGRSLYAKYGKNIEKVLFFSAIGASVCYLTAVFVNIPIVGLIACAFTGICVAMMWPGTLITSSSRILTGGVFVFAMMAAGGDFGAAVGPQLVGIVTDVIKESSIGYNLSVSLGIGVEQLAMKAGLLIGALFPIFAIFTYLHIWRNAKQKDQK